VKRDGDAALTRAKTTRFGGVEECVSEKMRTEAVVEDAYRCVAPTVLIAELDAR